MAAIKQDEIPKEKAFFTEFWNFRKKFYTWEDGEPYWSELVKASDDLSDKYRNNFFDMMLMACIDDIERRGNIAINAGYLSREPLVKKFYERLMRNRQ